ncbi:hypothetical protein BGZ52_005762 [Haplosporangium bisporale]|nr:hypothetical protein BGZ52_005762 [Haplosporangium bisporale]
MLHIQGTLATPQILHIILCTAPLLLEVVAPKAQYPSEYFFPPDASLPSQVAKDVDSETLQQQSGFDQASFSTTLPELIDSGRCSREVWACRGLRVLNLGIGAVDFGYIGTSARHDHLLAMARMTYAYLARVCPLLSELSLSQTDGLWPGLEGGLCLLGGLVHLELIEIQTRLLEQSGRGDAAGSDGLVDRDGLVGKWSLQEVKDVRSRLLGRGEQVWPRLTYLGIWFCASTSTLSVESEETLAYIRKVVRGMRPAIQFICKPLPP